DIRFPRKRLSFRTYGIYVSFFVKGMTVLNLRRAIANAPDEDYPPDVFAPERFLKERPPLNPSTYSYGFGRRLCPGKALAETVMFLMTAHILMAFDISREVDEKGEEIPIDVEYSSGVF
ncbi:hypothetical protein H0H93_002717, partial [Arthromyces matolae]